ncbi:hypothetical protein BU26DRAFT_519758 [Trematosphaeria pertusa]|uniref:Uncharacterized protein n=1 Tax=Trematosphaeria pertusa TaxID=390896 RepID=A0A6A6IDJ8_9PLEO|nr:uncharacterized protein BU26DRAFT_519758 [Trematosphaeria pertusa]KAF2247962.1 hypothetical protein BU26DRAFT_519758 [Trematosphaeria pertusa]
MASQPTKNWIPVYNFYWPPDAIPLGQVVSNPQCVHQPLASTLDFHVPIDTPIHIEIEIESPFRRAITKQKKQHKVHVGTPSFVPQGSLIRIWHRVTGGIEWGREEKDEIEFTKMQRRSFTPSEAFARRLIGEHEVHEFFKKCKYRKSVFVVTGVMTGEEGNIVHKRLRKLLGRLPVVFSADIQLQRNEKFAVHTPVVLAYKLCMISLKAPGAMPETKEFVKRAQW